MAFPYYDAETEGVVYLVRPEQDDACDGDGSDVDTISSSTTTRTASTITSDQIGGGCKEHRVRHSHEPPLQYFKTTFAKHMAAHLPMTRIYP